MQLALDYCQNKAVLHCTPGLLLCIEPPVMTHSRKQLFVGFLSVLYAEGVIWVNCEMIGRAHCVGSSGKGNHLSVDGYVSFG